MTEVESPYPRKLEEQRKDHFPERVALLFFLIPFSH